MDSGRNLMTRKSAQKPKGRPLRLDGAALDYAPQNELGVVFLFSSIAKKRFGLRVEQIAAGFPDCIAYRGRKKIRIEFEYKSRNFATHRHDPKACDWVVCWIHNWTSAPENLRIVELRKEFGLGYEVWLMPTTGDYREMISRINRDSAWSLPSQATKGDLALFYRTRPDSFIADIFTVTGHPRHQRAGWKPGKDWMGPIKRVVRLKTPLHLKELRSHRILKHANFVRGGMRGRYKLSPHWPEIYQAIIERNPDLESKLRPYGPEKMLGSW
jgi:hypothetical protein